MMDILALFLWAFVVAGGIGAFCWLAGVVARMIQRRRPD